MVETVQEREEESRDNTLIEDIARRVANLENDIDASKSSGTLGSIIARIKGEQAQIPQKAPESNQVRSNTEDAIKKASELKEQKENEEARELTEMVSAAAGTGLMAATATDIVFSRQVAQFMSGGELQFMSSLQGPQSLVMLDANGQLIVDANGKPRVEVIDGSLLQADFAHLKYHALDKAERDKIDAPPGESPDGKRLHEALLRLEGHHISRGMEAGMSMDDAHAATREDFARAHDQVNSTVAVEATARALEEAAKKNPILAMNAKISGLAAKYHEDKLGADLQKVVDDLSGNETNHRREQGIEVSGPTAQLHIGAAHTTEHSR